MRHVVLAPGKRVCGRSSRVVFEKSATGLTILAVGHQREVYR